MRRILPLVVTGVAAAAVGYLFARDLFAARGRLAGRSRKLTTRQGVVEFADVGQGAPALVLHGASGGFDQALAICGPLAERGYRLIAPSRFGYLGSSLPRGLTTALQADAYAELLDHLNIERAVVVAVSAGAWSAIEFAIRHPGRCRALILLVPASPLSADERTAARNWVRVILSSDILAWVALKAMSLAPGVMLRQVLGVDPLLVSGAGPGERERLNQILARLLPAGARARGLAFDFETAADPGSQSEELIACPVLTVSAEDDPFQTAARARSVAAAAPDGRAVIYPTGGHPLVGRQESVLDDIEGFLAVAGVAAGADQIVETSA